MAFRVRRRFVVGGVVGTLGVLAACADDDPPRKDALDAMREGTGVEWIVGSDAETGGVSFAAPRAGTYALPGGTTPDVSTLAFLDTWKTAFKMHDPRRELVVDRLERPADGSSHVRFRQQANGIPVLGGTWTAHLDPMGRLMSTSGRYVDAHAVATSPALTADAAKAAALTDAARRDPAVAAGGLRAAAPVLEVYAPRGTAPVLAWAIDVTGNAGSIAVTEHVDATSGAVLVGADRNWRRSASGRPPQSHPPYDMKVDPVTFPISAEDPPTLRAQLPNGVELSVVTMAAPDAPIVATTLSPWSDPSTPPGAAIAAQAHAAIVVDFFASHTWGPENKPYLGADGNGGAVRSVLNDPTFGHENAFWGFADGAMHFGDGIPDQGRFSLAGSLDIVAHEFTHGVVDYRSGLWPLNQSAAVGEGLADVVAALVTHRVRGNDVDDFTIGEDAFVDRRPIRSMIQPKRVDAREWGTPDMTYYNATTVRDAHMDSTVLSHAFYLMTIGDSYGGVKVPCGIGWAGADSVYWRLITSHLQSQEQFRDVALHTLAAARELQINTLPIACAWMAVGLLTDEEAKRDWDATCERYEYDAGPDPYANLDDWERNKIVQKPAKLVECPAVALTNGGSGSLGP